MDLQTAHPSKKERNLSMNRSRNVPHYEDLYQKKKTCEEKSKKYSQAYEIILVLDMVVEMNSEYREKIEHTIASSNLPIYSRQQHCRGLVFAWEQTCILHQNTPNPRWNWKRRVDFQSTRDIERNHIIFTLCKLGVCSEALENNSLQGMYKHSKLNNIFKIIINNLTYELINKQNINL